MLLKKICYDLSGEIQHSCTKKVQPASKWLNLSPYFCLPTCLCYPPLCFDWKIFLNKTISSFILVHCLHKGVLALPQNRMTETVPYIQSLEQTLKSVSAGENQSHKFDRFWTNLLYFTYCHWTNPTCPHKHIQSKEENPVMCDWVSEMIGTKAG